MNKEIFQTNDLYYGAYLLVKGNQLEEINVRKTGHKKVAIFCFAGPSVDRSAYEYISGKATANVNQLRASIDHLKRLAYEKIKN